MVVDRLTGEVRAILSRIDAKRRVKRRRLTKERDDHEWAAWCVLSHDEKERLFAAKYHQPQRKWRRLVDALCVSLGDRRRFLAAQAACGAWGA